MAASITETEIIAGLMADPKYPQWTNMSVVKDQALNLPDLLGRHRLDQPVTYRGLMLLHTEFCKALLRQPEITRLDPHDRVRRLLRGIGSGFEKAADLQGRMFDMYEPVASDHFPLNLAARTRYMAGQLSYAELFRLQPGLFVAIYDFVVNPNPLIDRSPK